MLIGLLFLQKNKDALRRIKRVIRKILGQHSRFDEIRSKVKLYVFFSCKDTEIQENRPHIINSFWF